jgi:hypothetical protein
MAVIKRLFMVEGKPFFPLGSERLYSSGYSVRNESETEAHFNAVKLARGNTLAIPIYWDEVEPAEGKFDFTGVDNLLSIARRYEMRLILLWLCASEDEERSATFQAGYVSHGELCLGSFLPLPGESGSR